MKLLLTTLAIGWLAFHQPNNAKFEFDLVENETELTVILQTHEIESYSPTDQSLSTIKMANYILEHLDLKVNGQSAAFEFEKSESTKQFTYLRFRSYDAISAADKLELKLDVFLHVSKSFINQVVFNHQDQSRSFKMSAERTQIELTVK